MSIRYNRDVNPTLDVAVGKAKAFLAQHKQKAQLPLCLAHSGSIAVLAWFFTICQSTRLRLRCAFLLVVLFVASRWGITIATTTAVVATLAFNYYFLPPVHTFTISDPQNWIALFAFLVSAISGQPSLGDGLAVKPKMPLAVAKRWNGSIP